MARKVFISVLGTSTDGKCSYCDSDGWNADETRFIQRATLQKLTKKEVWTEKDEVLILLTQQARTENWCVENNTKKTRDGKEEEYIGLQDELNAMHLPMPIKDLDIPEGKDEKEMWEIFDILYNALQDGDELYFDLTHGFRYIPMLVLVLGNYAHQLKHTEVKSLTYGNYIGKQIFVDLTPLATLQDWTVAVHDYLDHGDARLLKACSDKPLNTINKATRGQDKEAKALQELSNKVATFCENIRFNLGKNIVEGKESDFIKENTNVDCGHLRPLKPLLEDIKKSVEDFETKSPMNMIRAAQLCLKYDNYPSAATLLQEGIVSILCEKYGLDIYDENQREIINKAIIKKSTPYKYVPTNNSEKEKKVDEIFHDKSLDKDLVNVFMKLTEARNNINHGGMKDKELKAKKLREHITAVSDYLKDHSSPTPRPRLLINLSNHEFSKWSVEQQEATKEYGVCEDMPFPAIFPDMDSEAIEQLADRYVKEIVEKNKEHQVTVHLMGEMAFTHYAVSQLLRLGIPCICSTTARIVIEEADGTKTAQFRFARFRHYTD